MKTITHVTILCAFLLLAAPRSIEAGVIAFHVQVSTTPLIASASAPFSLDFTLTDGSGTLAGPNSVTLDHFTFGSGSPVGTPTLTGGASGTLASSVSLSDSANFLNEFYQPFIPGASLGFNVSLTTNTDLGFPDAFSFAILDKNLLNLPTTGLGDSLLLATITSSLGLAGIQTFTTTGPAGVIVTTSAVPEPTTLLLLSAGLAASVSRFGHWRRKDGQTRR